MARILLIDDDYHYRNMLKIKLEKAGHSVCDTDDGEKGFEIYKQSCFDIVLSDLFMPQIDGVQTIFKFKKEFPGVRIITITGANISEGRAEYLFELAKQCGANDVFRKADSFELLLNKINALL